MKRKMAWAVVFEDGMIVWHPTRYLAIKHAEYAGGNVKRVAFYG